MKNMVKWILCFVLCSAITISLNLSGFITKANAYSLNAPTKASDIVNKKIVTSVNKSVPISIIGDGIVGKKR